MLVAFIELNWTLNQFERVRIDKKKLRAHWSMLARDVYAVVWQLILATVFNLYNLFLISFSPQPKLNKHRDTFCEWPKFGLFCQEYCKNNSSGCSFVACLWKHNMPSKRENHSDCWMKYMKTTTPTTTTAPKYKNIKQNKTISTHQCWNEMKQNVLQTTVSNVR